MKKCNQSIFSLHGKVVAVTGAAGLLGAQHCEAIAEFGGVPIMLDINEAKLKQLSNHIESSYDVSPKYYVVDITNENSVEAVASMIESEFGKLDGLVNNAANNPKVEVNDESNFSRLEFFPLSIWNDDIAVGLTGAFLCSKHLGRLISDNKKGGVIINISSDLGLIAPDQRLYSNDDTSTELQAVKPVTYSVVKSGLIGLTRYLSTYWCAQNVRCNAICPGGIENGQEPSFIENVSSLIPMNRMAKKHEYKGTLVWMLSDAASYLNGSIVAVDGGRSAW
ncbi:SDR family oxidoreductase [Catenovulum sediminis]|uniref:SDR family oxidoreductase n=1 Tax=Catenovulum sediminis TaxID=1740262 RepID=A0ABV1RH29_9ALTE